MSTGNVPRHQAKRLLADFTQAGVEVNEITGSASALLMLQPSTQYPPVKSKGPDEYGPSETSDLSVYGKEPSPAAEVPTP